MSFYDSIRLIINVILVLIFIVVIIWFYLEIRKEKLEKRIKNYTILNNNENNSFFDLIQNRFIKWRSEISNVLKKSKSLVNYSKKYDKFIDKKKNVVMNAMDYVSTKFILSLLAIIILIISDVIQNDEITIIQIFVAFCLGFFSLDVFLISKKRYVNYLMENDLLKAITIMNNSFKSGRSIYETIHIVASEIDGPLKEEFHLMEKDLDYGLEIETVFERFNKRVNLKEVGYITTSLTILNKTGGNIVSVFSSIEKTVFSNKKLQDELRNLSAASKALYRILSIIPFIFVLVIYILDQNYFTPLFNSTIGIIILSFIVILYILYIIVVKKIIKLKEY